MCNNISSYSYTKPSSQALDNNVSLDTAEVLRKSMNTLRSVLKLMGSTDLAIDNMFARAHSESQSHTTTSTGVGIGSFFEVRNKYVCLHCGRRQQGSDPLCARCAAADISDSTGRATSAALDATINVSTTAATLVISAVPDSVGRSPGAKVSSAWS